MQELNCEQVVTLLTFYIEGKLSKSLSSNVENHLGKCKNCRDKYNKLRKILENFKDMTSKFVQPVLSEEDYNTPQYRTFRENLSAYVDNELSDDDNIKIKKIAIANPLARKDLEDIYSFKQLLNSSFNKTKNSLKADFSQKTLHKLAIKNEAFDKNNFGKVVAIFVGIVVFIFIGMLNLLYF